MQKLGEILREARSSKNKSVSNAAGELLIKPEFIEALESGDWQALPEPAYVRGFIKNYSNLLSLDANRLLALYRAEYDENKFPKKQSPLKGKKRLMFTPNKLTPLAFILTAIVFFVYLTIQYTSILAAPKLKIYTPPNDINTTASIVEVSGNTEADTAVSIDGELVAVDSSGDFRHQIKLDEGQNIIEIIASKRLSPKTKETRIIRLTR
ncbi:hypothetical protein A2870_01020 [Candidatus Curtissbacteria bacterium RIFCSPHIGHO2_01_FULL_41_11]|uniref:DUF4115 domain-containing protein n=1 Tax=Candidatus Curtissbacteria bacterium RIFCSPHIGHO2_01_FULL_41_11 TaxID=1797711 RepID=A0A1F5G3I9_9BACT|nr:MAG: hypothetical protein A2870_01020 [Candidatus Curtissbacteria bacterium RIFCSPHIGHO2_01_FULL_41_11]